MVCGLGKKEFVIKKGNKNRELMSLYLENEGVKFISKNAYVASIVYNGTIIANGIGTTDILVEMDGKVVEQFNVCVVDNSEKTIEYPILVNRWNGVPENFVPENLIKIEKGKWNPEKDIFVVRDVAEAYTIMADAAEKEGIFLKVTHGYRSIESQREIIEYHTNLRGKEEAMKICAPLGFSEHHTGLAIDVSAWYDKNQEKKTYRNDAYEWMENNCYKYGFMIKNLNGKESITGTVYEPWHLRYIGDVALCKYIYENYITLDEYLSENTHKSVELLFAGNVFVDAMSKREHFEKEMILNNYFKNVSKYIRMADMSICNFSGLLQHNAKFNDASIEGTEFIAKLLDKTGFNAITTLSYNLQECSFCNEKKYKEIFYKNNIEIIGDFNSENYYIKNINGINVCIISFYLDKNELDISVIINDFCKTVKKAKKRGADVAIGCVQFGKEYDSHSDSVQFYIAKKLVEAGIDAIFGMQTHVLQERYIFKHNVNGEEKEVPVYFSLGNCFSDEKENIYLNKISESIFTRLNIVYDIQEKKICSITDSYVPLKICVDKEIEIIDLNEFKYSSNNYKILNEEIYCKSIREIKYTINNYVNPTKRIFAENYLITLRVGECIDLKRDFNIDKIVKIKSEDAIVASVLKKEYLIANSLGYAGVTVTDIHNNEHLFIVSVVEGGAKEIPAVINEDNCVRDNYYPQDRVRGPKFFLSNSLSLKIQVAEAWIKMREHALSDGIKLNVVSGFRTKQDQLYRRIKYAEKNSKGAANNRFHSPGYSEHHSGYALDISVEDIKNYEEKLLAFSWLEEHSYKFGFVCRKINGDIRNISKIHLRYFEDKELVEIMHFQSYTLEEALIEKYVNNKE